MAYGKRKFPTAAYPRRILQRSMNVQKLDAKLRSYRRRDTEWTQYQVLTQSPNLVQKYVWHLTQLDTWTQRFGQTPGGVPYLHSIKYDFDFKCASEAGPTSFSCFLVSLRTDTMSQLVENQGANLQSGLVENIHYMSGQTLDSASQIYTTTGQVELNPMFFKIHKTWRFAIGVETFSSSSNEPSRILSQSHKRITGMLKMNKKLQNGRGNFAPSAMSTCDNSAKVFLLVFNDNLSNLEGSPTLDGQCMVTVRST